MGNDFLSAQSQDFRDIAILQNVTRPLIYIVNTVKVSYLEIEVQYTNHVCAFWETLEK